MLPAGFYLFILILSELFFHITHEGIHDHRPSACINYARALLLATEVARHAVFFFFLHLIPAHTFLILILQVASYKTHIKCQLTLITGRCGVLRSTRVLHTMLNRPGSGPGSSGLGSSVKTSTSDPSGLSRHQLFQFQFQRLSCVVVGCNNSFTSSSERWRGLCLILKGMRSWST